MAIQESAFATPWLVIDKGTTVTWVNNDEMPHTVTSAVTSAVKFDSGELEPGERYSRTFTQPGTYAYYCKPHPWMRGTVIVE